VFVCAIYYRMVGDDGREVGADAGAV